jgi:hypothetical protein
MASKIAELTTKIETASAELTNATVGRVIRDLFKVVHLLSLSGGHCSLIY